MRIRLKNPHAQSKDPCTLIRTGTASGSSTRVGRTLLSDAVDPAFALAAERTISDNRLFRRSTFRYNFNPRVDLFA
jgi:hypothetical protein